MTPARQTSRDRRRRAPFRRVGRCCLVIAGAALLAGCTTLKKADEHLLSAALDASTPEVSGAHGPLSAKQGNAIIARLRRQSGPVTILRRHLAIEQALTQNDLVAGNQVKLLVNGPAIYGAMFKAISDARSNIDVETYYISDNQAGRAFANLLIKKRREGCAVNVMYDAFGSRDTSAAFFQRMAKAGISLTAFNPVGLTTLGTVNNRDHRKLLIVDGRIAFVGGMNIRSIYVPPTKKESDDEGKSRPWRDTDVEIRGPVVATFQKFFFRHWQSQKGPKPERSNYFPKLKREGRYVVRAIASSVKKPVPLIYITLLSAINSAQRSIYITDAYFAPNQRFLEALAAAARRGVDVEMVLPSKTDTRFVLEAGRAHYAPLLDAGVKIYERKHYVLHAKTIVIDDVWSTVGSTNLDWRSFLHNDEVNAVILGKGFANRMQALFESDRANSKEITRKAWDRRSLWERVEENFAALWEWWL